MVLSSQHLLLVFQVVILASQSQHVQIENRVLLCQLYQPVLHSLVIVCEEGLQRFLTIRKLFFLFFNEVPCLIKLLLKSLFLLLEVSLEADAVFVQLVLREHIVSDAGIQSLNLLLLAVDLLILAVVYFKDFFKLQLKESVFMNVRIVQTNLSMFVVNRNLSLEFVRNTLIDLAVKAFKGLRRPVLAWNLGPILVEACDVLIMHGACSRDSLVHKLLNHSSELLVVGEQLGELVLIDATASCLCKAAAQVRHLLLHLSLHLSKTRVLEHVEVLLELFILLLQLVEVGRVVRLVLQQAHHILVDLLNLAVCDALVSLHWVSLACLVEHGLQPQLVLVLCALLFKLVVVFLQHGDQLFVVLDALLVVQLDRLKRDSIVVRNACHVSQLADLSGHVGNCAGQSINLVQFSLQLLLDFFFFSSELVIPPDLPF